MDDLSSIPGSHEEEKGKATQQSCPLHSKFMCARARTYTHTHTHTLARNVTAKMATQNLKLKLCTLKTSSSSEKENYLTVLLSIFTAIASLKAHAGACASEIPMIGL